MNFAETVLAAREANDWQRLIAATPFAVFLGLRMEARGEGTICVLPAQERLVGNPLLPALHGGAIAGFMECAAILYLLWHRDAAVNLSYRFQRAARTGCTNSSSSTRRSKGLARQCSAPTSRARAAFSGEA